jgi:hypothetical protein
MRAQAVAGIIGSSYADQHQVEGFYSIFLARSPDAGGLAFCVNALQGGATLADVAAVFASGPEFIQRAQATLP